MAMKGEGVTEIRYKRQEHMLRLKFQDVDDRELRCVIIGFWSVMDSAQRDDLIAELLHYQALPEDQWPEHLPPVSLALRAGYNDEPGTLHIDEMKRREHEE